MIGWGLVIVLGLIIASIPFFLGLLDHPAAPRGPLGGMPQAGGGGGGRGDWRLYRKVVAPIDETGEAEGPDPAGAPAQGAHDQARFGTRTLRGRRRDPWLESSARLGSHGRPCLTLRDSRAWSTPPSSKWTSQLLRWACMSITAIAPPPALDRLVLLLFIMLDLSLKKRESLPEKGCRRRGLAGCMAAGLLPHMQKYHDRARAYAKGRLTWFKKWES